MANTPGNRCLCFSNVSKYRQHILYATACFCNIYLWFSDLLRPYVAMLQGAVWNEWLSVNQWAIIQDFELHCKRRLGLQLKILAVREFRTHPLYITLSAYVTHCIMYLIPGYLYLPLSTGSKWNLNWSLTLSRLLI